MGDGAAMVMREGGFDSAKMAGPKMEDDVMTCRREIATGILHRALR